ncbi:MAG: ABC transporter ATP-binding protein, partial [Planctomycetes bacterium]|nr:ABC transporter ATP-binding protein [Planctomycetota bacterium]
MSDVRAEPPVLSLADLRIVRGGFAVSVQELQLGAGDVAALVGPSGCGKTTLLLGLAGLLDGGVCTGRREILGNPWPEPPSREWRALLAGPVTVVPQDARAALDPLQRVGVQVESVTRRTRAEVCSAFARLGLAPADALAQRFPHQLSGGQAQRVLLAVALLRAGRLILADEPTAALDGATIGELTAAWSVLRSVNRTAVLLATHDLELCTSLGARRYRCVDGGFVPAGDQHAAWGPPPVRAVPGAVVLAVHDLHKVLGGVPVLAGVDLEVRAGELVAVVGPSGSGKTTLARILAGHLPADSGRVAVERRGRAGSPVQLLFQDAYASLTPHRTVRSLLRETAVKGFDAAAEAAGLDLAEACLDRTAARLSGGERRRAALLRALSVEPAVLVLDEPTASLDRAAAVSVIDMIHQVQRRAEVGVVLITHDRE